jgi:hypothetical protein
MCMTLVINSASFLSDKHIDALIYCADLALQDLNLVN